MQVSTSFCDYVLVCAQIAYARIVGLLQKMSKTQVVWPGPLCLKRRSQSSAAICSAAIDASLVVSLFSRGLSGLYVPASVICKALDIVDPLISWGLAWHSWHQCHLSTKQWDQKSFQQSPDGCRVFDTYSWQAPSCLVVQTYGLARLMWVMTFAWPQLSTLNVQSATQPLLDMPMSLQYGDTKLRKHRLWISFDIAVMLLTLQLLFQNTALQLSCVSFPTLLNTKCSLANLRVQQYCTSICFHFVKNFWT